VITSLTLQQLRVFAAAAREGSFARAAEALSLSEPNVSTHVQTLERALGLVLFERSRGRRQLRLTAAGRILLDTQAEVQHALDRGGRALEALKTEDLNSVRVGVGVYFGGYLMPRLQDRFKKLHPEIKVRVEVFNEPVPAAERVLQGRLDMLIGGAAVEHPALVSEPFAGFDCVLVAPPGHRLANTTHTRFEALAEEEFVVRVRTAPSWRTLEAMAARHGMTLRVALESPDMDSEVQAVSSGVGLGVLPWETVAGRISAGQLVALDVEGLPIRAQRYLVYRRGPQSLGFVAFKQLLESSADIMRSGLVA
jgi:DNA-binding transcriptional LysR family regulator